LRSALLRVHNQRMAAMAYNDLIVANIRAAIGRRGLTHEDLAERMRQLGYSSWIRQTVSNTIRGKRKLIAEELLGISIAVDVSIVSLMLASADDPAAVTIPSGEVVGIERWMAGFGTTGPRPWQVVWDGNTPKLTAPASTGGER
jgi:transcriptional regulator with XRE-family HTH domain